MIRRLYYEDNLDWLLNWRTDLMPPKRMITGNERASFKIVGEEFFRYFIELCNLQPNVRVLDVGSGAGRMAIPLTKYLNDEGSYEGFDVIPHNVYWCQRKITPKHPNFRFHIADIYNKTYNQEGEYRASTYRFPYEDGSFDFVFLTSVFTHLLPLDLEQYLSEIARALKPNGKCLITYFLLNRESLANIEASKQSTIAFHYRFENYRIKNKDIPEEAIAYDEEFIRELYRKYRLRIVEPVHYGAWCGREKHLSFQDIIIADKDQTLTAA
jgi:SAM-dependent methyltransferase